MLEAAHVLESDIKRLSQGLRDVQCAHPHSHSSSHLQSWSLERHPRSPSRHWQGRRVTFWDLEVDPDPMALGHSSRIFAENGDSFLQSTQGQETVCPPRRTMAYQDGEGRENYPLEPSITDVETWLDWQAHQMDMPHWWAELITIPGVEDLKKLTWKIWASFLIPAVRSRVFQGQGYTAPHPKCLIQNTFLPEKLSYQDMWQQPFLLTVAYAWGLQYWVEKLNPPADPDFCPLARSVLELRERVKEHVIFSKQDVIQGLGRISPGTMSWWPQPTKSGTGRMESNPAGVWETHGTTPHHLDPSLRGETLQFPQPSFEWRVSWLAKMQAQLRLLFKLPPPPHWWSNWPIPSSHLIQKKKKSNMY